MFSKEIKASSNCLNKIYNKKISSNLKILLPLNSGKSHNLLITHRSVSCIKKNIKNGFCDLNVWQPHKA